MPDKPGLYTGIVTARGGAPAASRHEAADAVDQAVEVGLELRGLLVRHVLRDRAARHHVVELLPVRKNQRLAQGRAVFAVRRRHALDARARRL